MTSRKQTVQGECIMNEQQPNWLGHEDRSEWQRRKTRLQWLMWPSTQRIGKVIRASSYFSTRRVVDLVPEASSTAMTEDRHEELAAIDLSMIAVALTRSWLVWILVVIPGYIFHRSCFFFSVLLEKWGETLDYVSCFSLHLFRVLAATCVLYSAIVL